MNHTALLAFAILFFNAGFAACALYGARRGAVTSGLASLPALCILAIGVSVQIFLGVRQTEMASVLICVASMAAVTVCAATDSFSGYVFDAVTLPAFGAILALASFQHHFLFAAAGALAAGAAMALLYAVTMGRGLGLGDVKLACCIGAALGAYDALASLDAAFVAGGVYAAFLLLTRRGSRGDEMRFAPYLAAGMAALSVYRSFR